MSTDILVGIDGSENAERALGWALDEAEVRGVRVRAVLTWTYLGQKGSALGPLTTEEDAQAFLAEFVDRSLAGRYRGQAGQARQPAHARSGHL